MDTGLSGLITALTTAISADTLFTSVTGVIPFIGTMVGFAFAYRIVRKAVKGASKGKAGI